MSNERRRRLERVNGPAAAPEEPGDPLMNEAGRAVTYLQTPEKWAFRPGTKPEDIALAAEEIGAYLAQPDPDGTARAPGSASPIHLVAERKMTERLERERVAAEAAKVAEVAAAKQKLMDDALAKAEAAATPSD